MRFSPKEFNWPAGSFIIGYHIALAIGLPLYLIYSRPAAGLILTAVILLLATELGIGAAYHRYYAHRCYKLRKPAEAVLLFLATLAIQSSALKWSHDHRKHHAFIDSDADPYCIKKGFWYAHILWIFQKPAPFEEKYVPDLMQNKLVRFQDKHYVILGVGTNLLVMAAAGYYFHDFVGAFVIVGLARLFVSHHVTWFVNSLAHSWGERTYSREQSAVDNYALAFFTFGEGYHNYHHVFASDYRNGHRWYHFDPNKWVIWLMSKVGLAYDLKRFHRFRIKKQLLIKDRRLLVERLRQRAHTARVDIEDSINRLADELQKKLDRMNELIDQRRDLKKNRVRGVALATIRQEMKSLRSSIRHNWKEWCKFCKISLKNVTSS